MPYAVAAAGISAAGTIGGGLMQSSNTANAQKQSNWIRQLAVGQSQQSYNQNVQNLAPFYAGGTAATGATTDLLGLNGPDAAATAMGRYQTSPGYQWQLGEGLRAVDAAGAAGRLLPGVRSGATIKAEEAYGQGLANQDFTQYYNRLFDLSKQGFNAATGMDTASNNLTNAILGVGSSAISGATGAANAQNSTIGNTASSLGTTLGGLLQNKDVQGTLSGLFGSGSSPPINTLFNGFAPSMSPGQVGVGGFVAPSAPPYQG